MAYSKIQSIDIENFMVYKKAKVSFDETNIINLKGYNSSGKSTILKALAVCLMNMFERNQAKFIRHGEDYFRIVVTFDDGVSIVRDKYINGQSLYEVYKNGELHYTSKVGSRLGKVEGVPEEIQKYLGLCMLSQGCLNYQSREDLLWLVNTKGSENYASLNEILKTEQISLAVAMLNKDRNALSTSVAAIESQISNHEYMLEADKDYSVELYEALSDKEKVFSVLSDRSDSLRKIMGTANESVLAERRITPPISTVHIEGLSAVSKLLDLCDNIGDIKIVPSVGKVDVERLSDITAIASEASKVSSMEVPPLLEPVKGADRLWGILALGEKISEVGTTVKAVMEHDNKLKELKEKVAKVVAELQEQGHYFVQCDNCGTYVEVPKTIGA